MRRAEVVKLLAAHRDEIARRYGVRTIDVFGSVSRDDARPGSDVDLLVQFDERPTARRFFDLKAHLEELLGCEVDLATEKMLGAKLRRAIEPELLRVA